MPRTPTPAAVARVIPSRNNDNQSRSCNPIVDNE